LSLGAGVTWNSDERFGRPFIEEYMKTLWKERVQIVCSDILGTHDDFVVFGPRHSGANISCFGGFKLKSEEIAKDCSDEVAVMNKSEVLRC
jgi:hypothetical protein